MVKIKFQHSFRLTGDLLKMVICHGRSFTIFPNIFGIAGEMKLDQIPQLLPKKELVLEKVNT